MVSGLKVQTKLGEITILNIHNGLIIFYVGDYVYSMSKDDALAMDNYESSVKYHDTYVSLVELWNKNNLKKLLGD